MRTKISFSVSLTDRQRLLALIKDRNAWQKTNLIFPDFPRELSWSWRAGIQRAWLRQPGSLSCFNRSLPHRRVLV
jgi:hypothetical protein